MNRCTKKEEYLSKHEALMKSWRKEYKANGETIGFVEDGIISPDDWFSLGEGSERILILIKEAYSNKSNPIWSLPKWICHDNCVLVGNRKDVCPTERCDECKITGSTYNHVAEWIYGILENCGECQPWLGVDSHDSKEYRNKRELYLRKAAIVNIKKSGGKPSSNKIELNGVTESDAEHLREQIKLICPTMIICGATYDYLYKLFPDNLKEDKLYLPKSCDNGEAFYPIKVITACHPNAHKKSDEKYKMIWNGYTSNVKRKTE